MPVVFRVLLGFFVMGIGMLMVFKADTLLSWFGTVAWAEDKLGSGQSRLFYKLLGVVVAFLGIFIVTNIISDILGAFAGIFIR